MFDRKTDAQKWLRDKLVEIDQGGFISPSSQKDTVDEWAEVWWDTIDGLAENTKRPYHQKWKAYISPYFGKRKLADITSPDVDRFIKYLRRERGLANKTIRDILIVLIGIFDVAIKSGHKAPRKDNPARGHMDKVKVPKRRRREGDMLNLAQAIFFVDRVIEWYRPAVWLALHTGVRPSELWGLLVRDVNWERGVINIDRTYYPVPAYDNNPRRMEEGSVKVDSNRSVPIPAWLVDDLEAVVKTRYGNFAWRRPDDRLFVNQDGQPVNRDTFQTKIMRPSIERTLADAKAQGIEFPDTFKRTYDMRHSSVSILLSSGENPHEVAERHGHDISVMFSVYAHSQMDAQRAMTDRLEARFQEAKAGLDAVLAARGTNREAIAYKGRRPRRLKALQPPVSG
jgi:integrase